MTFCWSNNTTLPLVHTPPHVPSLLLGHTFLFLTLVPLNFSCPPSLNCMNFPSLLPLCLLSALQHIAFAWHIDLMVGISHQNQSPSEADGFSQTMSVMQVTQQTAVIRTSGGSRILSRQRDSCFLPDSHAPRVPRTPGINKQQSSPVWRCLALHTTPITTWEFSEDVCADLKSIRDFVKIPPPL